MEKRTFTLDSSDGKSKLSGFLFLPEGQPRAVVQICHGMCEYILRYEELAQHLTDAGYAVCGIDHLGHGSTARLNNEMLGYFGKKGAWNNLVEDQEIERKAISAHFAGLPYFLLGHSMGSFVARLYAARYGKNLQALLISGTAGKNPAAGPGKALVALVSLFGGKKGTSKLLYMLTTGNNNKQTEQKTLVDWICHDEEVCRKYIKDPWCSFIFTNSGYGELLELVDRLTQSEFSRNAKRMAYETFIGEIARKSAWKERISPHRAPAILKELLACEVPYCTPGGKPTLVNYSIPEIKRKFGIQA